MREGPRLVLPKKEDALSPDIRHTTIKEVEIVHVLRSDLRNLRQASDKESDATVFFGVLAGLLGSSLLGWLGIDMSKEIAVAFLGFCNLGFLLLTAWFGRQWHRAKQNRLECLEEIEAGQMAPQLALKGHSVPTSD